MAEALGERRIRTVSLFILAAIAVGAALRWLGPVMVPFVLSLFFALALAPLVNLLTLRLRFPRGLAVAATLLLGVALLIALGALVSASVGQLAENREAYQAQAEALLTRLAESVPFEAFGVDPAAFTGQLRENAMSLIGRTLVGTTNAVVDLLSQSFLVLIFMVFLLAGGLGADTGAEQRDDTWSEVIDRVERYIVAQATLSAATGLLVGGILAVLGIDLALVFGLFAFLLNFVPNIGSVLATLLPLPVVMMSPDVSPAAAVLAIALPAGVQFVVGSIIAPRVMGNSLDLHPVTILLALIFWGMLWGIVGMLLAAPITAIARLLLEKLPLTRPVGELLAGRTEALRGG